MDNAEAHLRQEVQELKDEVRRLKLCLEIGIAAAALAVGFVFPDVLVMIIGIGAAILFGFLVSPVRKLIFQSFLRETKSSIINHQS